MSKKEITLLDVIPVTAPDSMTPEMAAELEKYLMESTKVVYRQIPRGPLSIECEYDEAYAAPEVVTVAMKETPAVQADGLFVDCFGDPGVRAVRETLNIPVFGGFEPAVYLGLGLGDKLGIVTIMKNVVPMLDAAIARAGLEKRVTSIRTIDMPVSDLDDREKLMANLYRECRNALEIDGVGVLIMGCTGIVGVREEMTERLKKDGYDVPVLEAGQCAVTLTELYARMGLYQSRQTYMAPPKK